MVTNNAAIANFIISFSLLFFLASQVPGLKR
jgi:hypothetical protein